jgi:SOS-response transcriptional repressor LexA
MVSGNRATLNARQQQILDFIREYHLDRSYMPSVREIQMACGLSSTSVVDYNIRILEREGYLRRSPDISRGLELVGSALVDECRDVETGDSIVVEGRVETYTFEESEEVASFVVETDDGPVDVGGLVAALESVEAQEILLGRDGVPDRTSFD